MNAASRSILFGDLLSKRIEELEEARLSLDNLPSDVSREDVLNKIAALEIEIDGLKEEQKSFRRKTRAGYSSRQEADKGTMSKRLAYLKERSRKRAAANRLKGQLPRTQERMAKDLEWHRRYDRPGSWKKVRTFPHAEGVLKSEMEAAPMSRKARMVLREEEEADFLELPPVTKRTKRLPPSAHKQTPQKKKGKHRRERRREQRRKEEKGKKGGSKGTGHLGSFSGQVCSTSGQYPGWTRVDFVIDSGASATTIPKKLVGSAKLGEPIGYRSFKLADGNVVPNEGTLTSKAWMMGQEFVEVRMSVADISQPLLSVGQMVDKGNKVILAPKVSYLQTKSGGIHRIFLRNGVYVLPLWLESSKMASGPSPFEGQGRGCL